MNKKIGEVCYDKNSNFAFKVLNNKPNIDNEIFCRFKRNRYISNVVKDLEIKEGWLVADSPYDRLLTTELELIIFEAEDL